jgi:hypothetical protein
MLEETLELKVNGVTRRISESFDVQLDRWRIELEAKHHDIVVHGYDMDTSLDEDNGHQLLINTMIVRFSHRADLMKYGLGSMFTPIETRLYNILHQKIKRQWLSGRILMVCPGILQTFAIGADIEWAGHYPSELNPNNFGSGLYNALVLDRILSRVKDPCEIMRAAYRGLQHDGYLIFVDDANGQNKSDVLWRLTEHTLRMLLEDFLIVEIGSCGNSLLVAHLMAGNGSWLPLPASLADYFAVDSRSWPVHVWAIAKKK